MRILDEYTWAGWEYTGVPAFSYRDSWPAVERGMQVILWTSVFSHHADFTIGEVKRGTATDT